MDGFKVRKDGALVDLLAVKVPIEGKTTTIKGSRTKNCTLCHKKTMHLTFDYNISKCRLIFKILSLTDSHGNFVDAIITAQSRIKASAGPGAVPAEAIEMPFASRTRVGPGKHLLYYSGPFRTNTVLCSFNTIQPSSFETVIVNATASFAHSWSESYNRLVTKFRD